MKRNKYAHGYKTANQVSEMETTLLRRIGRDRRAWLDETFGEYPAPTTKKKVVATGVKRYCR